MENKLKFGGLTAIVLGILAFFAHPDTCVTGNQILTWLPVALDAETVSMVAGLVAVIIAAFSDKLEVKKSGSKKAKP